MRVIVQRVNASQVTVGGEIIGQIGRGLNLLVGIAQTDYFPIPKPTLENGKNPFKKFKVNY
jgi:D-Tyr-tRNAtyr deacylase